MNIKNKIVAMMAAAVLLAPAISFAQTTGTSVQAQIQALLAQLQTLQAQVNAQGGSSVVVGASMSSTSTTAGSSTSMEGQGMGGSSNAIWCYAFGKNLSIGMTGPAVTALQTALAKDGESVTVSGSFDEQTASAVTGFQEKYSSSILTPNGLANGTGFAGAATRAKLNALFGCMGGSPQPITTSTWPIIITTSTPCVITPGSGIDCNPIPVTIGSSTTSTLPIRVCPAWGCNGPEPIHPTPVPIYGTSTTSTPPIACPGLISNMGHFMNGSTTYNCPPFPIGTSTLPLPPPIMNSSTASSSANANRPMIASLLPASGTPGMAVTITGSGFVGSNVILFGGYAGVAVSSTDGATLSFNVPLNLHPDCRPGQGCPQFIIRISPGIYPIRVENANGISAPVPFVITSVSSTLSGF